MPRTEPLKFATVPAGRSESAARAELDRLRDAAQRLPAEELPELIGQLESIKATAWARLAAPSSANREHDELLEVEAAAQRLGVSKDYLYRHHADYAFTHRQGRKLLFSALGIDKHIKQQRT